MISASHRFATLKKDEGEPMEKNGKAVQVDIEIVDDSTSEFNSKKNSIGKKIMLFAALIIAAIIICVYAPSVYQFYSNIFMISETQTDLSEPENEVLNQSLPSYTQAYTGPADSVEDITALKLEVIDVDANPHKTELTVRLAGSSKLLGLDIDPSQVSLIDSALQFYYMRDSIDTLSKDDIYKFVFRNGPSQAGNMTFKIRKINGVVGNWSIKFMVTPNIKKFKTDVSYTFRDGTELTVTEVIFYKDSIEFSGVYSSPVSDDPDNQYEEPYEKPLSSFMDATIVLYIDGNRYLPEYTFVGAENFGALITFQSKDWYNGGEIELELTEKLYEDEPIRKQIWLIDADDDETNAPKVNVILKQKLL